MYCDRLGQKINTAGSTLARVYSQKVLKPPPILQVLDVYMSLSKCSPWFGGHSVVKVLSSQFELDDTQNKGLNKMSWSQLSDGLSCLSWWFDIFMAKMVWFQETVEKGFFWQQWNCIVNPQKTNSPLIYYVMVGCQFVLICLGHHLSNDSCLKKLGYSFK